MTLLQTLFSCSHPIEMHNQCSSPQGTIQACARCGAYRWLGSAQVSWTRPTLIEEAVARAMAQAKEEGAS